MPVNWEAELEDAVIRSESFDMLLTELLLVKQGTYGEERCETG